jgi:F-type H+-transporting ATPase subunit delta
VNPALQGYGAAVFAGSDVTGTIAAELAELDAFVRDNATMFTAMTDTSIPAAARRAVLADLLEGRVSEPVRRAAAFAVGSVKAPEVPLAIDWLAHRAGQVAEGEEVVDTMLGHMAARERVGGFAAAVFEDVTNAQLEEIEDELFRFTRTVADAPALRTALSDRDLPVPVRQALADQLLEGKVEPATQRLVGYAIAGGRPRDLVGTLDWLVEETARARGWRVARVQSAQTIDDAERQHLVESLSQLSGHPVELQVTVDPELLAGVVVHLGDLRLEATARGQLEQLREHMSGTEWENRFGQPSDAA